jgi:hypothetical protein
VDDDALLNQELHWSPRPGHRKRPSGANAITAIGLIVTIVLWAVTGVACQSFLSGPSGGGMIDPRAVLMLVLFGGELLVAAAVAGRVWVAIGPTARGLIRPFGVLGPLPLLVIGGLAGLFVVSMVLAPFLPRKPASATSGANWRVLEMTGGGVTYEEAVARCAASGSERVPSRDDLASFDPPYSAGARVWLEKPDDATLPIILDGDGTVLQIAGNGPDKPPTRTWSASSPDSRPAHQPHRPVPPASAQSVG